MTVQDACTAILGEHQAARLAAEMGITLCILAAMNAARDSHPQAALKTIKAWSAEQKRRHGERPAP